MRFALCSTCLPGARIRPHGDATVSLSRSSGRSGRAVTAQGSPRARFRRAIEGGHLLVAEATARELGRLTLEEALRLVLLYAEREPARFERAALRWVARYLTESKNVSLLKAQLALCALAELRFGERAAAAKPLAGLVQCDGEP